MVAVTFTVIIVLVHTSTSWKPRLGRTVDTLTTTGLSGGGRIESALSMPSVSTAALTGPVQLSVAAQAVPVALDATSSAPVLTVSPVLGVAPGAQVRKKTAFAERPAQLDHELLMKIATGGSSKADRDRLSIKVTEIDVEAKRAEKEKDRAASILRELAHNENVGADSKVSTATATLNGAKNLVQ